MRIYQQLRILHTKKLWFALNITLTLIYSIKCHLSKSASVNTFFNLCIKWTLVCIEHYIDFTLFNYLLSVKRKVCIDTFFTCVSNGLWFALNIMITFSYICYSINDHLSKNVHIKAFQLFYMCDFDITNCWNTKGY